MATEAKEDDVGNRCSAAAVATSSERVSLFLILSFPRNIDDDLDEWDDEAVADTKGTTTEEVVAEAIPAPNPSWTQKMETAKTIMAMKTIMEDFPSLRAVVAEVVV